LEGSNLLKQMINYCENYLPMNNLQTKWM